MEETQGNKGPLNKPGVYKHTESGAEITALSAVQADAFVRMGFQYIGPVKTEQPQNNDKK